MRCHIHVVGITSYWLNWSIKTPAIGLIRKQINILIMVRGQSHAIGRPDVEKKKTNAWQ